MTEIVERPGPLGRLRSRQAGRPSGLLGRVMGRAMVKDTAVPNDAAIEMLDVPAGSTVLDVGFGQGRTIQRLVRAGYELVGVEVSPTMLSQATARNRTACRDGRARLVLGDGVTLPLEDDSVDGAITVHTVYFMPDPARTIRELSRVLRPDALLVMACRVGEDAMPGWMDPGVYRIPTSDEITEMLESAGFRDVARTSRPDVSDHTHWFSGRAPV